MADLTEWSLTRINQGYRMTRVNHTKHWIEDRAMTKLETVWFWITGRLKKYNKEVKRDGI